MTGITLLPMPMGVERIFEVEMAIRESETKEVDIQLKNNIEEIFAEWSEQVNDILKENSTSAVSNNSNPLPSEGDFNKFITNNGLSYKEL